MDSTDFDQRPGDEYWAAPSPSLLQQVEVVKFMKTVFLEEHLINNLPEDRIGEDIEVKEMLESLTGRTNWTEASVLKAKAKIEQYCLQPWLSSLSYWSSTTKSI